MSSFITISGNATADPEKLKFSTGSRLAKFRLATSRRRLTGQQDPNGKDIWEDVDPLFIDVECWGQLGENVVASVKKGFPVTVSGRLVTQTWEDKPKDGGEATLRQKIILKAQQVSFDLSNYQVSSVRVGSSGNTLQGQEPVQVQTADDWGVDTIVVSSAATDDDAPTGLSFADTPGDEQAAADDRSLVGAAQGDVRTPF